MSIHTRYGSEVQIVRSYKEMASLGIFLVQASVIIQGAHAPVNTEVENQLVDFNDPFSRGWIPNTELIGSGGPQEVLNAACDAADGTPTNPMPLLKLYWPALFGFLGVSDVAGRIAAGLGNTGTNVLASVRKRFSA